MKNFKKTFLLFLLSFFITHCFSQTANASLPKMIDDTLYTTSGYKIISGQNIKLGTGSNPNGDFKYITATNSPFPNAPNTRHISLSSKSNGHIAKVKKIKKEGSSKNGYVYRISLGTGDIINYECDIESAIAAGEVVVPDQYKTKSNSSIQQPTIGVADELTKLKKLYDDSVITKEEYEAQKKKLLDGNN